MTTIAILQILFLLAVKHFVVDFPMQKPYQWQNKGTYGHPGGILHSGFHALGTGIVFSMFAAPGIAAIAALVDGVAHYHIDWAKMNLNRAKGWKPDTHEQFWVLLGLDQFLHTVTYIVLVGALLL